MTQSTTYQNHQINFHIEGNGEVLIFLHGWPTNSNLWKSQVQAFKTNYKTITFDWLGFGKSDKPIDHTYTFTKKKEILSTYEGVESKVKLLTSSYGGG